MATYYEKNVTVRLKYSRDTGNARRENEFNHYLTFSHETHFSQVSSFVKDMKALIHKGMEALKRGDYVEFEITRAVYLVDNEMPVSAGRLTQVDFDRWFFEGRSEEEKPTGIYLRPDTRYTDEVHDIWMTPKTLWEDIGNV